MTSALDFGNAAWTLFLGLIYVLLLSFAVGVSHDYVANFMIGMGIDATGTAWDSSQSIYIATALLYFILSFPPFALILGFILSVTRRQRRDDYAQDMSMMDEGDYYG